MPPEESIREIAESGKPQRPGKTPPPKPEETPQPRNGEERPRT